MMMFNNWQCFITETECWKKQGIQSKETHLAFTDLEKASDKLCSQKLQQIIHIDIYNP
jgi:hypothetical protein